MTPIARSVSCLALLQPSMGWSSSVSPRRLVLQSIVSSASAATVTLLFPEEILAETIGKDQSCNNIECLGVWDGLLASCPHPGGVSIGAGCASSQDDTPGTFAEPWDYSEADDLDWKVQQSRLTVAIESICAKRNEPVRIVVKQGRYMRVLFEDARTFEQSIGEFYFTPDDTTVQFRLASTSGRAMSMMSLRNMQRSELIRQQVGYLKLPVLRNRKRTLLFGESDFDTFGPRSAFLGPPAEMTTGELEGIGRDVDPRLKIDFLEQFPKR